MKRATASVDRTSTALVGLALIALGGGAIAWERGELPGRERLDAAFVDTAVDAGWWPWALGAAAIVLVLLGLWWLLAHLPRRSVGTVAFASTADADVDGRLSVDLGTAARSAAKSWPLTKVSYRQPAVRCPTAGRESSRSPRHSTPQ